MTSAGKPLLSVVLSTLDRAASLERTLASLAGCTWRAGAPWELVLVDNGSSDRTALVAQAHRAHLPLRRVLEPTRGLSSARNRGLAEAKADLVAFTDDDVELDVGWLEAWVEAAAAFPAAAWFGGRILPRYDGRKPRWLRDESMPLIAGLLGYYDRGEAVRLYADDEPAPFGACFGLRRTAWERVGRFRTDLGMVGREPGRGEETDYLARARAEGLAGAYVGNALVWHRIPADRFAPLGLVRWGRLIGRAQARTGRQGVASRARALGFVLKSGAQWLRCRGDRARQNLIHAGIQWGVRAERARLEHEAPRE